VADILYKTFEDGKKTDEAITGIAFALRILPEKNPKLLENFTLNWPGLRKNEKSIFATHSLDEAKKNPAGKIKSGQTNHQTKK